MACWERKVSVNSGVHVAEKKKSDRSTIASLIELLIKLLPFSVSTLIIQEYLYSCIITWLYSLLDFVMTYDHESVDVVQVSIYDIHTRIQMDNSNNQSYYYT